MTPEQIAEVIAKSALATLDQLPHEIRLQLWNLHMATETLARAIGNNAAQVISARPEPTSQMDDVLDVLGAALSVCRSDEDDAIVALTGALVVLIGKQPMPARDAFMLVVISALTDTRAKLEAGIAGHPAAVLS
jgi:hypothetical protein